MSVDRRMLGFLRSDFVETTLKLEMGDRRERSEIVLGRLKEMQLQRMRRMLLLSPRLWTTNVERKMRPRMKFYKEEMKRDLEELSRLPRFFCTSLEGRIKPRHNRLVEHGFSLPLYDMLAVNYMFDVKLKEMLERGTDEKIGSSQ